MPKPTRRENWKHGYPLALVDKDMPVIAVARRMMSFWKTEIEPAGSPRGEANCTYSPTRDSEIAATEGVHSLRVPARALRQLSALLHVVPLQLAYHVALVMWNGCR